MAGMDWTHAAWDQDGKPIESLELVTPDGFRVMANRTVAVIKNPAYSEHVITFQSGDLWMGPLHVVAYVGPFQGVIVWAEVGMRRESGYQCMLAISCYNDGDYFGEIAPDNLSYLDLIRRTVDMPKALQTAPLVH